MKPNLTKLTKTGQMVMGPCVGNFPLALAARCRHHVGSPLNSKSIQRGSKLLFSRLWKHLQEIPGQGVKYHGKWRGAECETPKCKGQLWKILREKNMLCNTLAVFSPPQMLQRHILQCLYDMLEDMSLYEVSKNSTVSTCFQSSMGNSTMWA